MYEQLFEPKMFTSEIVTVVRSRSDVVASSSSKQDTKPVAGALSSEGFFSGSNAADSKLFESRSGHISVVKMPIVNFSWKFNT